MRPTMRLLAILSVSILCARDAAAVEGVTLDLVPTHSLPLIPPLIRITVPATAGDRTVDPDFWFEVRAADGSWVEVGCGQRRPGPCRLSQGFFPPADAFTVRKGMTGMFLLDPSDVASAFANAALAAPGTYDIKVRLASSGEESSPVKYVVDTPSGEDAVIFAKIAEVVAGQGVKGSFYTDPVLLPMVLEHSTSSYARVFAFEEIFFGGSSAATVVKLQKALDGGLPGAYDLYGRLLKVTALRAAAMNDAVQGKLDAATSELQAAQAAYKAITDNSPYVTSAKYGISHTVPWTMQELRDFAADTSRGKSDDHAVEPHVTCTRQTADGLLVLFGYTNPNRFEVVLPIGADNAFTPAPPDRGQPTTFLPGPHPRAFTVTISGRPLVWKLGNRTGVDEGCTP